MTRWLPALMLAAGLLLLAVASRAQDHEMGHMRYHSAYQHWKQPGTDISCCNARVVYPGGGFVGDCYPTEARLAGDHWVALRAKEDGGGWVPIPDDKIIREHNPDPSGRDAHLCYAYGRVLCFVPPAGTM